MKLNEKINMARKIQNHIAQVSSIWPGFTTAPFILYDGENQVAVGNGWPEQYSQADEDIWTAEGCDPLLMGCTAIQYHNRLVAVWDTRSLPENPSVAQITAGIAHEMFHCFQLSFLMLPFPNELLQPQYPHSQLSVALMIKENELLIKMLKERDALLLKKHLEVLFGLRKQRKIAVGSNFFAYDDCVESMEGTAAYVEKRMVDYMGGNMNTLHDTLPLLTENGGLLAGYRMRCMASGIAICLTADILCPGWQSEWPQTKLPIYTWLEQKLMPESSETELSISDLQLADSLISAYRKRKEQQINDFMSQALISFDGDIGLISFDPMNIVCYGSYCLHTRMGRIRFGQKQVLLEHPFVTEIGNSVIDIRRVFISETERINI